MTHLTHVFSCQSRSKKISMLAALIVILLMFDSNNPLHAAPVPQLDIQIPLAAPGDSCRTVLPIFLLDNSINSDSAAYTGTIAVTTARIAGDSGASITVVNLAQQDTRSVGEPFEDNEPGLFSPSAWVSMGELSGITLDSSGNIYAAATTGFSNRSNPGRVYKIHAADASFTTFADIPGDSSGNTSGAGLGNVTSNVRFNQDIFVVSLDTGLIYRYASDGSLQSSYDHGIDGRAAHFATTPGDNTGDTIPNVGSWGISSQTISGRRLHAVEVHESGGETRLYYSVTWRYGGNQPQSSNYTNGDYNAFNINIGDEDTHNQVWSIQLDPATGDFVTSTARLEFSLDPSNGLWDDSGAGETNSAKDWPIADIAFTGDGRMIVATRGMQENVGGINIIAHEGQVIEATPSGGSWSLTAKKFDGFAKTVASRDDGSGGVAWDPTGDGGQGRVWITGEALWEEAYDGPGPLPSQHYNIFGMTGIDDTGVTSATTNDGWQHGIMIDVNSIGVQEKQSGGDVEIACGGAPTAITLDDSGIAVAVSWPPVIAILAVAAVILYGYIRRRSAATADL